MTELRGYAGPPVVVRTAADRCEECALVLARHSEPPYGDRVPAGWALTRCPGCGSLFYVAEHVVRAAEAGLAQSLTRAAASSCGLHPGGSVSHDRLPVIAEAVCAGRRVVVLDDALCAAWARFVVVDPLGRTLGRYEQARTALHAAVSAAQQIEEPA